LSGSHLKAPGFAGGYLLSVTTFFRDHDVFKALAAQVVPLLFEGKEASGSVRIWVPGCDTGEEAYSVGILLLEELSRRDVRPRIQVFGSDLDTLALATAREGRYPATIEADVSEERLRRFFTREGDHYRVKRELREIAIFAFHSVLRDPPFSRMDLISCRNLLIYLDRGLQEQVIGTFHYALNPGGFLLLGSSETADNPAGLFRPIDRRSRIYQSAAIPGDRHRALPRLLGSLRVHEYRAQPAARLATSSGAIGEAAAHRQALEKIAPPSILIDDSHRVLHLSDHAGRHLQPAGGPLTGDLAELVREELRFEMRGALHRAFEQRTSTLSVPIPVRFNGLPQQTMYFANCVGFIFRSNRSFKDPTSRPGRPLSCSWRAKPSRRRRSRAVLRPARAPPAQSCSG
jgi:two-component system CheB/CheR fusion protein